LDRRFADTNAGKTSDECLLCNLRAILKLPGFVHAIASGPRPSLGGVDNDRRTAPLRLGVGGKLLPLSETKIAGCAAAQRLRIEFA
jgi:hypothetical protein